MCVSKSQSLHLRHCLFKIDNVAFLRLKYNNLRVSCKALTIPCSVF